MPGPATARSVTRALSDRDGRVVGLLSLTDGEQLVKQHSLAA